MVAGKRLFLNTLFCASIIQEETESHYLQHLLSALWITCCKNMFYTCNLSRCKNYRPKPSCKKCTKLWFVLLLKFACIQQLKQIKYKCSYSFNLFYFCFTLLELQLLEHKLENWSGYLSPRIPIQSKKINLTLIWWQIKVNSMFPLLGHGTVSFKVSEL